MNNISRSELETFLNQFASEVYESNNWSMQYLLGLSLAQARLYTITANEHWLSESLKTLDLSFKMVSSDKRITVGLHSGLAGLGVIARTINLLLPPSKQYDVDVIDSMLFEYISNSTWNGNYDLIDGLVGCGIYALYHPSKASRQKIIASIYERLNETKIVIDDNIYWKTFPKHLSRKIQENYPNGLINLGLAHGIPGITALSAKLKKKGIVLSDTSNIIFMQSIKTLKNSIKLNSERSYVSYYLDESSESRCAWCYGEPGYAMALFHAGEVLNNSELVDIWHNLFIDSVNRSDTKTLALDDVGICHGWGGIYLIASVMEKVKTSKNSEIKKILKNSRDQVMAKVKESLSMEKQIHFKNQNNNEFVTD